MLSPLTTEEAKTHLRVDFADDDTYIDALIDLAYDEVERYTRRALLTQTLRLTLPRFPVQADSIKQGRFIDPALDGTWVSRSDGVITLPRPPVQSITNIKYYNENNVLTTWPTDEWESDLYADSPWVPHLYPTRITPSFGYTFPVTYSRLDAVQVNYVAGWESASAIPKPIIHAMKMLIGDMYENREDIVVGALNSNLGVIQRLLWKYRAYGANT